MNFKRILEELVSQGLSQAEVGRRVGMAPPTVVDLMSGKQKSVKWETGEALIALRFPALEQRREIRPYVHG